MSPDSAFNDPLTYAAWVDETREVLTIEEGARWLTGDKLLQGEVLFPDLTTAQRAEDLKIAVNTAYERMQMSAYYDASARAEWTQKGLSYSILREARALGPYDEIRAFLQECVDRQYTVRTVQESVREKRTGIVSPERLTLTLTFRVEGRRVYVEGVDGNGIQAGQPYVCRLEKRA